MKEEIFVINEIYTDRKSNSLRAYHSESMAIEICRKANAVNNEHKNGSDWIYANVYKYEVKKIIVK